MLSENIKNLRKENGMSQEELAAKLNVVRQTVSKWEQNLSVPDSEMLISIAEIFDVSVSQLLGETVETNDTKTELEKISQKLENLNEMIAQKNSRNRRILLVIVAVCLIIIASVMLLFTGIAAVRLFMAFSPSNDIAIIGGADGPTSIMIASTGFEWVGVVVSVLFTVLLILASVYILKKIRK
ncbi:MAG: helix-turn-helix domain-containing protein [Clostridia bacterium]|nr:helix-turn-helix domain-containing protein [Clostridia bacterium]